jgi:hypothetical protein
VPLCKTLHIFLVNSFYLQRLRKSFFCFHSILIISCFSCLSGQISARRAGWRRQGCQRNLKIPPTEEREKYYSASERLRYSPFHPVTFTLSTVDIAQFAITDSGLVRWCEAMQITYELDQQGVQNCSLLRIQYPLGRGTRSRIQCTWT